MKSQSVIISQASSDVTTLLTTGTRSDANKIIQKPASHDQSSVVAKLMDIEASTSNILPFLIYLA